MGLAMPFAGQWLKNGVFLYVGIEKFQSWGATPHTQKLTTMGISLVSAYYRLLRGNWGDDDGG